MKICELYQFLNQKMSPALSCEWDNDGLMCCADEQAEIKKVLIALDITGEIVDLAIAEGYDLILSHHPLIFSPLKSLNPQNHVARKVISLLRAGITAMSFHTRLDATEGGVNDTLVQILGLEDVSSFAQGCGRIGTLPRAQSLTAFAETVKSSLDASWVQISDAGRPVQRVALVSGSGSDEVIEARNLGADTFLTGELKHNLQADARDLGINLLAAGHYDTENPVCARLAEWVLEADPTLTVYVAKSNTTAII